MRSVSAEYRLLDKIFKHETKIPFVVIESSAGDYPMFAVDSEKLRKVIAETYECALRKKNIIYEMACGRFRKKESYIRTCIKLMISPAKYYRLLRIFFKLAQRTLKKYFET